MQILNLDNVSTRADEIRKSIREKFVGQDEAVDALANLIDKYHSNLLQPNKPIGTAMFLGPTGTGKTRLVEVFCDALFHNENACVKIDCGEFQHSHEIAKLIGSPPGYLGHKETPARLNTNILSMNHTKEYPISVILFDEIEKASDALWHIMLSILDKAVLTLGDNSKTDFSKTIIIMTSNAGSAEMSLAAGNGLGFHTAESNVNDKEMARIAVEAAKRKFTPEFINRIDELICFNTLKKNELNNIVDIELNMLQTHIINHVKPIFFLKASPAAKKAILADGFDEKYNARSIKRAIEKNVQLPLAKAITTNQLRFGDVVMVDYKYNKYTFAVVENISDNAIKKEVEPAPLSFDIPFVFTPEAQPEPATEKSGDV